MKVKFKSIGTRIRKGYVFVVALMLMVIFGVVMASINFNNKYNLILSTINKSNEIQDLMEPYTFSLVNQLSLADKRKNIYNSSSEVREKVYSNLYFLDNSIASDDIDSRNQYDAVKNKVDTYFNNLKEIAQNENMSMNDIYEIYQQTKNYNEYIGTGIKDLIKSQLKYNDIIMRKMSQQFNATLIVTCIVVAFAILISFVLSVIISSGITKTLKMLTDASKRIAEGDLSEDDIIIKSNDEIKILADAFNKMKNSLRMITQKVHDVGLKVSASAIQFDQNIKQNSRISNQISLAIQNIAAGAVTQAKAASDTTQTVEVIKDELQIISQNSENVLSISKISKKTAEEGTNSVSVFIDQINQINETMKNTASSATDLIVKSKEIEKIITVIKKISQQSNLLSLNATIEAAQAGQFGAGFAVVADEVKKLAEQSAISAGQITQVVMNMQKEINSIKDSIFKGAEEVKEATKLVASAHSALSNIEKSNTHVHSEIQSISTSISTSLDSVKDIFCGSSEISNIARNFAASCQEIAASSEEQTCCFDQMTDSTSDLTNNALELKKLVKNLKF